MAKRSGTSSVLAAFVAAALLGVSAHTHAAYVAGPDGKPVRGKTLQAIGDKDLANCKLHLDKRTVKLNLEPDMRLVDVVARMSSITCKQFLVPSTIVTADRKLTIIAPELIMPGEAYVVFLNALGSIGITVENSGRSLRLVETADAKTVVIALQGYVTRLVRFDRDDTEVMAQIFRRIKSEPGSISVLENALVITDLPDNISRMLRIAYNP